MLLRSVLQELPRLLGFDVGCMLVCRYQRFRVTCCVYLYFGPRRLIYLQNTLKMEGASSYETLLSVLLYTASSRTRRLHQNLSDNLKSVFYIC